MRKLGHVGLWVLKQILRWFWLVVLIVFLFEDLKVTMDYYSINPFPFDATARSHYIWSCAMWSLAHISVLGKVTAILLGLKGAVIILAGVATKYEAFR